MNETLDFSLKLKEARIKSGLSQNSVAEKLNISRQAVSRWENQKGLPSIDILPALSKLYGISMDDLFDHKSSTDELSPSLESSTDERLVSREIFVLENKLPNTVKNILFRVKNIFNEEVIVMILLMILTDSIYVLDFAVSIYIFIWTWKNRKHYKLVLVLTAIFVLIGSYHLYLAINIFFPFNETISVEKIA